MERAVSRSLRNIPILANRPVKYYYESCSQLVSERVSMLFCSIYAREACQIRPICGLVELETLKFNTITRLRLITEQSDAPLQGVSFANNKIGYVIKRL